MSRTFLPDQILIDRLLVDDTEAFEELYRRHWYSLYSYSYKKLCSSHEARRIVRDIFIQLWEKRHSWPADFSLSQHLYTEVRKAVVESLNATLNITTSDELIEKEIIPGFTAEALQQAKLPVAQKRIAKPPIRMIQQSAVKKDNPKYFITLAHLKWLFQTVTAKLL